MGKTASDSATGPASGKKELSTGPLLYVRDRREWRRWLSENHASQKAVWLVYYKKHSGKKRIPYEDAVEEAICFGWIDSTVRKWDEERYVQKYTPRRADSIWSALNVRRAKKMIRQGRMKRQGMERFRGHKRGKGVVVPDRLRMPADLGKTLREGRNRTALGNFAGFPASHKKMYYWWIRSAKKPETRKRRIKKILEILRRNKKTTML